MWLSWLSARKMWLSGISGHGGSGLVSLWSTTIKSPWLCTVICRYILSARKSSQQLTTTFQHTPCNISRWCSSNSSLGQWQLPECWLALTNIRATQTLAGWACCSLAAHDALCLGVVLFRWRWIKIDHIDTGTCLVNEASVSSAIFQKEKKTGKKGKPTVWQPKAAKRHISSEHGVVGLWRKYIFKKFGIVVFIIITV